MVKNVSSVGVNYNAIQARKLTSSNNLYNKSVPEDKVQFSSLAFKGAAMNKVVNDGAKAVTKKLPVALAAVLALVGIKGLSKTKESGEEVVLQEKVLTPEEIAEKQAAALKAKQESAEHPEAKTVSKDFNMESNFIKEYYPVKSISDNELIISAIGSPWDGFKSVEVKYGLYKDTLTSIELVTLVNKDGSCIKIINGEDGQATAKYIDKKGVERDIPLLNFEKLKEMNKELLSCRRPRKREAIIQKYQKNAEEYKNSYGLGGNNTTEEWMISTGDSSACLRKNSIKHTSTSSSSSSSSSSCPEAVRLRAKAAEYRRLAAECKGLTSGLIMDADEDAYSYYMGLASGCEREADHEEFLDRLYRENEQLYFKMY